MKKLFILMLLPLALTGCFSTEYTMDYKCVDGSLKYTFKVADGMTGIVDYENNGVAYYRDTGKTVKCVE